MTEIPKVSERERLIKQLSPIIEKLLCDDLELMTHNCIGELSKAEVVIADFILADRRRIVEPLVKFNSQEPVGQRKWKIGMIYAIDETLKLAGIE